MSGYPHVGRVTVDNVSAAPRLKPDLAAELLEARDLALRLRAAQRIRLPGPGCTGGAAVESIDDVKGGLRDLLRDLGAPEPERYPPKVPATATAFPVGTTTGNRPIVQHRRRVRRTSPGLLPLPEPVSATTTAARAVAEALFAPSEPAVTA